jgi:hypothetical protein
MLVPLKDATQSLTIAGETVHLFAFQPDVLRGVILGANATLDTEAAVRDLLSDLPELRHVRLTRARLDLDSRSVKVTWADCDEVGRTLNK